MELPMIDLEPYLDAVSGADDPQLKTLCSEVSRTLAETGALLIKDPRITVLLDRTNDRELRHRLLLLLKVLMKVLPNVEASVLVGGCVLAVDLLTTVHEVSERTAIPFQSNLIDASAFMEPLKEWLFIDNDGAQAGPVGESALSILHSMVSAHSDIDDAGEIVTPTPRVKRILSSPRCLPHIAQAMLSGEPAIVEVSAALIKEVVTRNPKAMIRLYSSGIFYFAVAYPGSNLLTISQLFSTTHAHQAFHGGEEAAVSSSLQLAKRSVLSGLLPESLIYVLERSGPTAFAAAMVSDSDTPEIIWTHKMRADNLIHQFNFRGIISSCFESHLMVYVELEERTLMEHLEKLVQDETWDMDDGSQTNILSSSMQTSDKDESLICYIVNTAESFHKTAVNQLCSHFDAYRDIPKITELRDKFKNIKQILKSHVFSDFSKQIMYLHAATFKHFSYWKSFNWIGPKRTRKHQHVDNFNCRGQYDVWNNPSGSRESFKHPEITHGPVYEVEAGRKDGSVTEEDCGQGGY